MALARTEQRLQTEIVVAFRRRFDAFVYHVPNGGARTRLEAIAFKDAGATAGVPDLVVQDRRGRTLYLELKAAIQKRERVVPPTERILSGSDSQQVVIPELRARGFTVAIVDSVEEAVIVGEEWGLEPRRAPVRSELAASTGF